jgi:ABC-type molybdate transport system substrate-binding protein
LFAGTLQGSRYTSYIAALAVTMLTTTGGFAERAVTVLYAGSLVGLMERGVGPAFKQQAGDEFRGHAGGSQELAKKVKEGALQGDVFISADPKVNALLSGPTNEDRIKWYVTFAESPLVLGISPSGARSTISRQSPQAGMLPMSERQEACGVLSVQRCMRAR